MDPSKRSERFEIEWSVTIRSRQKLRETVVRKFLSEKPGYWKNGTKYSTSYKYYVEMTRDNRRIFLLRPTFLNKGIDFQVWVERFGRGLDKRPSHKDIFQDLKLKQSENPVATNSLLRAIDSVWLCEEPDVALLATGITSFRSGMPNDLLLKILKWLFIEQDITYWNYDGRAMLRIAINRELNKSESPERFGELFPEA